MQCFENYIPLSFEHEKSKNNMKLTKVHPWLTEIDCFFFSGRLVCIEANPLFEKASRELKQLGRRRQRERH